MSLSREVVVTVLGEDRTFDVHFSINSFGHSGNFMEPPEGPDIDIEEVFDEAGNRVTEWCNTAFAFWKIGVYRNQYIAESRTMRAALFGEWRFRDPNSGGMPVHLGNYLLYHPMRVTAEEVTVMEAIMDELNENVDDYVNDEPDYDFYYSPDTRGEHDV